MDLTLSYFEPFILSSTKQEVEAVLLGQEVGAVHESRLKEDGSTCRQRLSGRVYRAIRIQTSVGISRVPRS